MNDEIIRDAVISPCGLFRYWLSRVWDLTLPRLIVCMLNPSTGDREKDDRTILNLTHFAKLWGYGGIVIINLRAYRSSKPAAMFADEVRGMNVHGPANGDYMVRAIAAALAANQPILIAWGNNAPAGEADNFITACAASGVRLICFGKTLQGQPIHPAARGQHAVPRDAQPVEWSAAA